MTEKIRVGLIFGGKSAEHEVSLQSAKNIVEAIDTSKFEPVLIGIDKEGHWHWVDKANFLLNANNPRLIALNKSGKNLSITPGVKKRQLVPTGEHGTEGGIDVAFPVLHGPYGEDGSVQGLLKLANIPFVGASVLGSAVGMDKDVMKRILRDGGVPIARFLTLTRATREVFAFNSVRETLGLPFFVKPANLGSSVGINRVENKVEFTRAIDEALEFDRKGIH